MDQIYFGRYLLVYYQLVHHGFQWCMHAEYQTTMPIHNEEEEDVAVGVNAYQTFDSKQQHVECEWWFIIE